MKRSTSLALWMVLAGMLAMGPGCGDGGGGTIEVSDTTPPGVVTDLVASPTGTQSIRLFWTAVGDDGVEGTASLYDIRHATDPGTRWESMTQITGEPPPAAPGTSESMQILGLQLHQTYYLRIRVSDEERNASGISNVATATTLGPDDLGWQGGYEPFPHGEGIDGTVLAAADYAEALVVGGRFVDAGGTRVSNIARWDGVGWAPMGAGANGAIRTLRTHDGILYAGGDFTRMDGIDAGGLAMWNGTSWSRAADDLDGPVTCLASYRGNLVVGGGFANGGDLPMPGIGMLEDGRWVAMGSGMDDWVQSIVVDGQDLYAGGFFTHAGGDSAVYVAHWDGGRWRSLGSGRAVAGGAVFTLAFHAGHLYAGGSFTEIGLVDAPYLARWDGIAWSAMDDRIQTGAVAEPAVYALAEFRGSLIAGGRFDRTGRCEVSHIVGFDSEGCQRLGSGIDGGDSPNCRALAVVGGALVVGGSYEKAGNRLSRSIAVWDPVGGRDAAFQAPAAE